MNKVLLRFSLIMVNIPISILKGNFKREDIKKRSTHTAKDWQLFRLVIMNILLLTKKGSFKIEDTTGPSECPTHLVHTAKDLL